MDIKAFELALILLGFKFEIQSANLRIWDNGKTYVGLNINYEIISIAASDNIDSADTQHIDNYHDAIKYLSGVDNDDQNTTREKL